MNFLKRQCILTIFLFIINISINAQINYDSVNINLDITNLQKQNNKFKAAIKRIDKQHWEFIKEYNNQIHSQQYKNDSLYDEIEIINEKIDFIQRDISKIHYNISRIRKDELIFQRFAQRYFNLLLVLIILVFIGGAGFIIFNRKLLNKKIKEIDSKVRDFKKLGEQSLEKINSEYYKKTNEIEKLVKETNDAEHAEFKTKLNDFKAHVDARLRELASIIDDKF